MLVHRKEFPRDNWLPSSLLSAFKDCRWVDESWHNNACPSFERNGWVIWCEAKDRESRELRGYRYTVLDSNGNDVAAFERTNDLIAWLYSQEGE